MKRVAIVVNTRYGQTDKIALQLRQGLLAQGLEAHVFSIRRSKDVPEVDISEFDGVIIGAPVYQGKFSNDLIRWTRNSAELLNSKNTGFFTVSGNAGDPRKEARAADDMLIKQFLNQTGLKPLFVASFGGCIHYTKYNFLLKFIMKKINEKATGPADTTRDLELTDWSQVVSFGSAFVQGDVRSRFAAAVRLAEPQSPPTTLITTSAAG
jgi:menaquinone-dependent protoporphyrinogen oxidase